MPGCFRHFGNQRGTTLICLLLARLCKEKGAGAKAQIFAGLNGPTLSRALIQSSSSVISGRLLHSADLDLFALSEMYKLQAQDVALGWHAPRKNPQSSELVERGRLALISAFP
jgi:hypothetical protein